MSRRFDRGTVAAVALIALLVAVPPRDARADAQQQQNFALWKQMQDCARIAFKQFPDYTPEGKAKREAARQECLRQRRLPITAAQPSPTQ
jgi:hypothetical protein